jgi:hypothetical protein
LTSINLQVTTSLKLQKSAILGPGVGSAIKESASVLNRIGIQHEDHGKRDLEQLMDWLYTYKGLLSNVPDMLNVHKVKFLDISGEFYIRSGISDCK